MRRLLVVMLGVSLTVLTGCSDDGDDNEGRSGTTQPVASSVYFGAVGMTTDRLAIAFDGDKMRSFLTDGEPGGDAEWFEGAVKDARFDVTSASGKARLEGTVETAQTHGTVTLADGVKRHFHTIPATHGAGIYDVRVTPDGQFTGTSTDGSKLEARQAGDYVEGSLTLKSGDRLMFKNVDLSRVFKYSTAGGQADTYTLVVSRYGLVQMGRGGDRLKQGSPDANVISLDLTASTRPTQGIYYGRTAQSIHQLAVSVDAPDAQGQRRFRMYFSDGLPSGDIEWFTGMTRGGQIDITSASKKATITGTFTDTDARGTIKLANGQQRPFFAVPAGDGAGIYEIDVSADKRYTGTSEKGDKLDAKQNGDLVTGTITTAAGQSVPLLGYDLTGVFEYSQEGSKPDHYIAFASPGGRYFIGRSGDVRGGSAGLNIIGLDKAC